LSAAASAERASATGDKAAAAGETTAIAAVMAANNESTRAAIRATDVALARVEAIKIKDSRGKIFQASSESIMHPTSKKVAEAMEHLLPHEITERELEMQEAAEIEEHHEEELRVAEEECYFLSLRWFSLEEERVMQQSRDKYFPPFENQGINPVGGTHKSPIDVLITYKYRGSVVASFDK
jgi:hypothetical protein